MQILNETSKKVNSPIEFDLEVSVIVSAISFVVLPILFKSPETMIFQLPLSFYR